MEPARVPPEKFQLAMAQLMRRYHVNLMSMGITIVVSDQVATMAMDRWGRLYVNPEFCESVSVDELAGVLFHELCHLALEHHVRGDNIRGVYHLPPTAGIAKILNIAADLSINPLIRDFGFQLPRNGQFPEDYDLPTGKSMEEYFARLLEKAVPQRGGSPMKVADPEAGGAGEADSESENGDEKETDSESADPKAGGAGKANSESADGGKKETDSESADSEAAGAGKANSESAGAGEKEADSESAGGGKPSSSFGGGSASHGITQPWELPPDDPNYPAASPATVLKTQQEVARAIQQVAHAKHIGTLPGDLQRVIDRLLADPPQTDWRSLLKIAIREAAIATRGYDERSYRKPRRREPPDPRVLLPSGVAKKVRIGVVVDTSGSVTEAELQNALVAIWQLARSFRGSDIRVVTGDTATQTRGVVRTATLAEVLKIPLAGGGGTDMNPLIEDIGKEHPSVIIVMTDGYTPWNEASPAGNTPIIVALLGDKPCTETPPWVFRTIRIGGEGGERDGKE